MIATYLNVPIGRQKGQPITDQHDDNLDWCLQYYMDKLNATGNETSRYREEWITAIAEIRAEQLRRYPGGGPAKAATAAP